MTSASRVGSLSFETRVETRHFPKERTDHERAKSQTAQTAFHP